MYNFQEANALFTDRTVSEGSPDCFMLCGIDCLLHVDRIMVEKSLQSCGREQIGLKFSGVVGSPFLWITVTIPFFYELGVMEFCLMTKLKISCINFVVSSSAALKSRFLLEQAMFFWGGRERSWNFFLKKNEK